MHVISAVLGQRIDKKPTTICYASKTLADAQHNYTTTEKKLFAVVFALEKFRPYILGSKIIVDGPCRIEVLAVQERGQTATN